MKRGAKTETFLHPVTPQLFFLKVLMCDQWKATIHSDNAISGQGKDGTLEMKDVPDSRTLIGRLKSLDSVTAF